LATDFLFPPATALRRQGISRAKPGLVSCCFFEAISWTGRTRTKRLHVLNAGADSQRLRRASYGALNKLPQLFGARTDAGIDNHRDSASERELSSFTPLSLAVGLDQSDAVAPFRGRHQNLYVSNRGVLFKTSVANLLDQCLSHLLR